MMITKISPEAVAKWPVDTKFISKLDELDDDEHGEERITPAGSVWEVTGVDVDAGVFHIACPATGAWICPCEKALSNDFSQIEA